MGVTVLLPRGTNLGTGNEEEWPYLENSAGTALGGQGFAVPQGTVRGQHWGTEPERAASSSPGSTRHTWPWAGHASAWASFFLWSVCHGTAVAEQAL